MQIRKYVSPKLLRSSNNFRYFAIFVSYLSYGCLVWAQNFSSIKQTLILQEKAVRIINFQRRHSHASPLFKQNFILKIQDKIFLESIFFVSKSLNNLSSSIFNTWFSFSSDQHHYETWRPAHANLSSWNVLIRHIYIGSTQYLEVLLNRGIKSKNN